MNSDIYSDEYINDQKLATTAAGVTKHYLLPDQVSDKFDYYEL